jgi:SAM-dependent methyltransferase
MTDASESVDFDRRPPVPVDEYRVIVKQVNVGYELVFALVHSFLRALRQDDLHVLVVGAGGGAEIEWLPSNLGWRMTGVDPSRDMLAVAQTRAEQLGVTDRVSLIQGTIHDVPAAARFDAATCLFVLHFLGDADKLELLREINARRRAASPCCSPPAPAASSTPLCVVTSWPRGSSTASLQVCQPTGWHRSSEISKRGGNAHPPPKTHTCGCSMRQASSTSRAC